MKCNLEFLLWPDRITLNYIEHIINVFCSLPKVFRFKKVDLISRVIEPLHASVAEKFSLKRQACIGQCVICWCPVHSALQGRTNEFNVERWDVSP